MLGTGEFGMREKTIELKLSEAVRNMKGLSINLTSPGFDGLPDRLVILPNRKIGCVEVKASGKKLKQLQQKRKQQLESLGFIVFCLDDPESIGGMLDEIQAT